MATKNKNDSGGIGDELTKAFSAVLPGMVIDLIGPTIGVPNSGIGGFVVKAAANTAGATGGALAVGEKIDVGDAASRGVFAVVGATLGSLVLGGAFVGILKGLLSSIGVTNPVTDSLINVTGNLAASFVGGIGGYTFRETLNDFAAKMIDILTRGAQNRARGVES